jgi:nicotinamide-nucleotide amidase
MDKTLAALVGEVAGKLTAKRLKLSIGESCTGGMLANAVTDLPGASKFFELSLVSYSDAAKRSALGVGTAVLKKFGAVSEETASEMARGVRKMSGSDVALAVTGIAGPEPVEGKEVGLVYIAVAVGDMVESKGMKFTGSREDIKKQAALEALTMLRRVLDIWA